MRIWERIPVIEFSDSFPRIGTSDIFLFFWREREPYSTFFWEILDFRGGVFGGELHRFFFLRRKFLSFSSFVEKFFKQNFRWGYRLFEGFGKEFRFFVY